MISRMLLASLVNVLALGPIFAPLEVSARGGGFAAGTGVAVPGGFHGIPARPFASVKPGFQHAVPRIPVHIRALRFAPGLHGDRRYRSGLGVAGDGPYYGSSYDPNYAAPYYVQPAYAEPPYTGSVDPALVTGGGVQHYRRGCRSVVETVPSERGGTSKITITRCGVYFAPSYDPNYVAPYSDRPVDDESPYTGLVDPPLVAGGGVQPYRRGCRSVVEAVPSGRGGTSEVTITRC